MKTQKTMQSVVLAMALAALPLNAAYPQDSSADQARSRHILAINLLRAINTAEFDYHYKTGSYVSWDVLRAKGEFTANGWHWFSGELQVANAHFTNAAPQILPDWRLRLNVAADGKTYDLLLEDLTDKTCGYAAGTDERGIIRQSKTIDCDI